MILVYFLVTLFIRRAGNAKTRPSLYLVLVTTILFLGSTVFLSFDIADLVARMNFILIDNPDEAYQDKLAEADDRLKRLVWTGEMLFIFMVGFSDITHS